MPSVYKDVNSEHTVKPALQDGKDGYRPDKPIPIFSARHIAEVDKQASEKKAGVFLLPPFSLYNLNEQTVYDRFAHKQ